MREDHGPNLLLYSLSELRPSEARRKFRQSIFEDYLLRGPHGQAACAYCGKWHERLTLDHIVAKSKGGPHYARWNSVPACFSCNSSKSNLGLFEWWRPQRFWSQEREEALMTWVYVQSFVSAHTIEGQREQWMEKNSLAIPAYQPAKEKAVVMPPLLCMAS